MLNFPRIHASPEELVQWLESHLQFIENVPCHEHNLFGEKGTNDFEMTNFEDHSTTYNRKNVLAWSFNAFDRMFFNDTLHRRVRIEIVDPKSISGSYGKTNDLLTNIPEAVVPISPPALFAQIELADISENPDFRESSRLFIVTLLHEMIHAFFIINTCRCSLNCQCRYGRQIGVTGHGTPWMKVALQIEKAMNHYFDGYWNLNRSVSFAKEYFYDPNFDETELPEELIRSFEISADEVEEEIGHLRGS